MAIPAPVLLTARAMNGKLTITAEVVTLQAPGNVRAYTVQRDQVTRVDHGITMPRLAGFGGAMWFRFIAADGHPVEARGVPWAAAQQVKAIFGLA